jgi:hypothetical protein
MGVASSISISAMKNLSLGPLLPSADEERDSDQRTMGVVASISAPAEKNYRSRSSPPSGLNAWALKHLDTSRKNSALAPLPRAGEDRGKPYPNVAISHNPQRLRICLTQAKGGYSILPHGRSGPGTSMTVWCGWQERMWAASTRSAQERQHRGARARPTPRTPEIDSHEI